MNAINYVFSALILEFFLRANEGRPTRTVSPEALHSRFETVSSVSLLA